VLVAEDRVFDFVEVAIVFCHLGNSSGVRIYVDLLSSWSCYWSTASQESRGYMQ
jgi:hypothetical protein